MKTDRSTSVAIQLRYLSPRSTAYLGIGSGVVDTLLEL